MKLSKFCNKISLILQALWCAVLYFLIEALCRHSVVEAWDYMTGKPLVFAYNTMFIFTTMLIVYLFHRRCFWRVVVSVFWLFLGIVNCILLMNRVTPFTGPDLHMLTDGIAIMQKYLPFYGVVIGCILIGIVVLGLLILLVKGPKYEQKIKYRYVIPLVIAGFVAFGGVTQLALEKRVLSNYFGNIAFAYEDYGYPYCLATTIFNTGISEPRDYSEDEINRIEKTESNLPKTKEDGKRPNILFLQLESFFDPTLVNYLDISEDPIPNFRKLMKEYSSGYYKVPSVGAGTANTEFETITGMSLHYFGPGEYPYKSILKETTCESVPYVLKNLGYSTHAVHNNEANFYGRRSVFPNLGFDTFTSEEYMADENLQNPLGWVKDSVLTDEIIKCLDSTDSPDYVYTISVQGHGDYPSTPMEGYTPEIKVTNFPVAEQQTSFEYYVNQIHEMDKFIGELIQSLSERDEETVLVLYGDHLPTFDFTDEMLTNGDKFQTQYVIWSNFDMDRQEKNIQAYQLSAYVMQRLGISEGYIMKYHQSKQKLPEDEYLKNLKILEYDILYGKKEIYGGETPYEATNLKMGIDDIEITDVYNYNNTVFIEGSSFNDYSCVLINGKEYTTEKVSDRLLRVNGINVKKDDVVVVAQKGDDKVELSRTTFTVKQQSKKNAQQQ